MAVLFAIFSAIFTLFGLAKLVSDTWRHFRMIFLDCFGSFSDEVLKGYSNLSTDEWKYIHEYRQYNNVYQNSIEEYLSLIKRVHKNNSKIYADIFNKMKSHKIRIFFKLMIWQHISDTIIVYGFKYDFNSSRLGE